MEDRELSKRYGYYIDTLQELAEFPLWMNVKINDLNPPRGVVQKAYNEIDKLNFKINLIDYLCLISLWVLLFKIRSVKKIVGNNYIDYLKVRFQDGYLDNAVEATDFNEIDINEINSARLFLKKPEYVNEAIDELLKKEKQESSKKKIILNYIEGLAKHYLKYDPKFFPKYKR